MHTKAWLASALLLLGPTALFAAEPAPAANSPQAGAANAAPADQAGTAPAQSAPAPAMGAASEPAAAAAESQESAPGPLKVAVPNMRTSGADANLASTLTDVLTVEANKLQGVSAIGMADIEALLGLEEKKQLLGCDDVSCMAEIGGALGVDAIVASKLGMVGKTYILTVRAIDTKAVTVIGSTQEEVDKPDDLVAAARRAVPAVLAPRVSGAPVPVVAAEQVTGEGGMRIVWPAMAVAGVALVGLATGVGFGIASRAVWDSASGNNSGVLPEPGDPDTEYTYWQVGTQAEVGQAQIFGLVAIGAGVAGGLALAGGVLWQLLAGTDDGGEEVTP